MVLCLVCLSVCLSVTRRYCIERAGRIEEVLTERLPSDYPSLCWELIRVSPKIRYFTLKQCPKLWSVKFFFQLHVDRRKCCQLRSTDDRCQFVHLWVQVECEAARGAGLSAWAESCKKKNILIKHVENKGLTIRRPKPSAFVFGKLFLS